MKQTITVNVKFPNGLTDFQITNVYLGAKNTLIVLAQVHTSNNMNDAVRMVSDSVTVETGFASELLHKVYFINNTGKKIPSSAMKPNYSEVSAIDGIPEINGLSPLESDKSLESSTSSLLMSSASAESSVAMQPTPGLSQNSSALFWRDGLLHMRLLKLSNDDIEEKDDEVKQHFSHQ